MVAPVEHVIDWFFWLVSSWEGLCGITVGALWLFRLVAKHISYVSNAYAELQRIGSQLRPNGGGSIYDAIKQIADGMGELRKQLAHMELVVTTQVGVVHQLCCELGVAIFHADRFTNCQWVSPQWCALSGMAFADAVGQGWRSAIDQRDRERVTNEWDHCTEAACVFRSEFRFRRPDGTVVWISCHATPIKGTDGQLTCMVAGFRSIARGGDDYVPDTPS
jgi:PAS domain S-box-containing protein